MQKCGNVQKYWHLRNRDDVNGVCNAFEPYPKMNIREVKCSLCKR